jgi:hypothetical protein
MLVETKQRLEKLQKLLKAEKIQPVTAKRAAELFKKVFTTIKDPVKGLSKFRKKYPKYFKTITQEGAISSDGQKLKNYLEKTHKNLTEDLSTSSTELNKKAKTNLKVGTLFNLVKRFNEGKKNKFILRGTTGTSEIDPIYANSKKFKEYYDNLENYPKFEEAKPYQKKNAHKMFLRRASSKIDPNFPLTTEEFVNKIGGIKAKTIPSYLIGTGTRQSSVGDYIRENFKYKRRGGKELRWKEPSDTAIRQWNRYLNSRIIKQSTVDNVETLFKNEGIRKTIFTKKQLPLLEDVQKALNIKSPTTAAYSMSILARKLKGEQFRTPIDVPLNVVVGKRILNQIGDLGPRDAYRTAFYSAALSNIDGYYRNKGATSLKQFKTDFNNELKSLLSLGKDQKVPFSVNEVIGISTGEMRGLQPYSAFVDVTERNINEKALAQYQGKLSRKIGEIQDIFADRTLSEAEKVTRAQVKADILKNTEGFKNLTEAQKASLGLAEIKIGTKIDPKIYSPEQLARYKEMGLDIQGMADREGFYIDTKGRRPFFEVSTKELKKVAEKLSKKEQIEVCSLLAGGGLPGNCARAIDENPVKFSQIINESTDTSPAMQKLKTTATNFLKSPLLRGAGKFGALAAVGAAGAGAVKTFMNDDPTTYLSNEEQQKNMLIDMVTGQLDDSPVEEAPIGDAYLPTFGAVAVAGTAATAPSTIDAVRGGALGAKKSGITKTALKTLGKGLATTATPLGLLATEPLYLAEQVQEGASLGEMATDPFNYLGPAFVGQASDFATKGLKSPGLAKAMRLGISPGALKTVSRRFGIPGLALSLGISGYEMFDDYKNKRGFFREE